MTKKGNFAPWRVAEKERLLRVNKEIQSIVSESIQYGIKVI